MKKICYILLCSIFFTACSTSKQNIEKNNIVNSSKTISNNQQSNVEENAFEDEFASEFEEKPKEVFDPLSGYNRAMTSFNDFMYMHVLRHVSKGYSYVVPQKARLGISNFFDNLMFPIRFANNLLQFKIKNATEELGRFLINSTFGLAGFMDPAKEELGWEAHKEDFGQTLGFYGVGEGFHIVLPFLGPSNLRDLVGFAADSYVNPTTSIAYDDLKYKIPKNTYQSLGISSFNTINGLSLKQGQYESLKKDALDLYPFLRDIYTQKRNQEIKE